MKIKREIISFLLIVTLLFPFIVMADDVTDTINNITDWIIMVSGALAILMYTISGFLWMSDAGNAERVKMAKSIFFSTTIGLVIILLARAIVGIVGNFID